MMNQLSFSFPFFSLAATASICSSGRQIVQTWKTNVNLECRVVGNVSGWNWAFNSKTLTRNWMDDARPNHDSLPKYNFENSSHLSIQDLKRTNAGNYTCSIKNSLNIDTITYNVLVIGEISIFGLVIHSPIYSYWRSLIGLLLEIC